MSNKNKWAKSLKLKRSIKVDIIFKSYWIRKFLSKITKFSKWSKTENFLQKILLNLKKLQINKSLKLVEYLPKRYLKKLASKKQQYFKSVKRISFYNFSNRDEGEDGEFFCPRNFNNYTLNKFLIFRSDYFRVKNKFSQRMIGKLYFVKPTTYSRKHRRHLQYKFSQKTLFANMDSSFVVKKKPIGFLLRAIDKIRWVFTTQLRRMGKYFHSIPTTITFPRTINYGLKKLSLILDTNIKNKSYYNKLNLELFCILFKFKKSICRYIRRLKLRMVKKNAPYSHFRWK